MELESLLQQCKLQQEKNCIAAICSAAVQHVLHLVNVKSVFITAQLQLQFITAHFAVHDTPTIL